VADDKSARRKVPTLIPSHSVCFKEGPRFEGNPRTANCV
jgi:hypothetical protein